MKTGKDCYIEYKVKPVIIIDIKNNKYVQYTHWGTFFNYYYQLLL